MIATEASTIRERLASSALAASGGVSTVKLLSAGTLTALDREAGRCRAHAETVHVEHDDGEEHRGGSPDRWLESAVGGPKLRALYGSTVVRRLLARLTGVAWLPSGEDGSYSYYCRPGHHLGIHRDVDECDLAVIVCVGDSYTEDPGLAGTLCVYPSRTAERLSAIRSDPERGASHVRLKPGEAAIILGGLVPHRVLPVGADHTRMVAPLCFRAAG